MLSRSDLKDVFISPEALKDIRAWGVDQLDELTRRELYMSLDDSKFKSWPERWPKYYNGRNEPCDMLIGPCSCGAWHYEDEFYLHSGIIKVNRFAGMHKKAIEEMFEDFYV